MSGSQKSPHKVSWFGLVALASLRKHGWGLIVVSVACLLKWRLVCQLKACRMRVIQKGRDMGLVSHVGELHSRSALPLLTERSWNRPLKLPKCFSWVRVNIPSGQVEAALESKPGLRPKSYFNLYKTWRVIVPLRHGPEAHQRGHYFTESLRGENTLPTTGHHEAFFITYCTRVTVMMGCCFSWHNVDY